jgi:DNA mismatch endonuclease (patch repair protein)
MRWLRPSPAGWDATFWRRSRKPPREGDGMADNLARDVRSYTMRQVRSRDTTPELVVRRLLRALGLVGYRIHRSDLPGRPDIAWLGRKRALFVHGCFWHGHRCKRGRRTPASNRAYWSAKILRNRARDARARAALRRQGWSVVVVWECELRDLARLEQRLLRTWGPGDGAQGRMPLAKNARTHTSLRDSN